MAAQYVTLGPDLDAAGVRALDAEISRVQRASDVRVLVLIGSSDVFCRGMRLDAENEDPAATTSVMRDFARCLTNLRLGKVPTLAVVDGVALGGGVGLAAACDVVIATEYATFGLPEAIFGLAPEAIFPVLAERLPANRVRLLALDASARRADDALVAGLVDEIVPRSECERAIARWVRALSRCAPGAVTAIKHLGSNEAALMAAIEQGAARTVVTLRESTVREALAAFAAGEAPWGHA